MNFTDVLLMVVSGSGIPIIVAIMLDVFYAEKKKIRFSLRRTSVWYTLIFGVSLIISTLLVTQSA